MASFWGAFTAYVVGVIAGTVAWWAIFCGTWLCLIAAGNWRKAARLRRQARRIMAGGDWPGEWL